MATVIDVRQAADTRDVIHRAVQALVEGKLVAFPTETVYGLAASALNPEAVQHLLDVKSRQPGHPLTLVVKSADDAMDYVPRAGELERRLARRCWPGPITLVVDDNHPESLLKQLPDSVQQAVAPNGTVGLRVPAHRLILEVLNLLAGPLTLTSANRSGEQEAISAAQVVESFGEAIDLVLDDGEARYGQASSVIYIHENKLKVLREGVVANQTLQRLASFMVVLVCTGNTCRSPMAEVMLRKRLAAKLGCEIDQLDDQGVLVASAGLAAAGGMMASPEAVAVMQEKGLDLTKHASQPLSERLVRDADLILTMTQGHLRSLQSIRPDTIARSTVLRPDGHDIADPIGGPKELYRECARQIDQALQARVDELDLNRLRP